MKTPNSADYSEAMTGYSIKGTPFQHDPSLVRSSKVFSDSRTPSSSIIQTPKRNALLPEDCHSGLARYVYNANSAALSSKPNSSRSLRLRQNLEQHNILLSPLPTKEANLRSGADVSIPGMGKLFDDSYSTEGKIAWGIAIAACFITCVGLIGDRIAVFFKVPVEIEVDVTTNSTLNYPSITICPFYPLQFSSQVFRLREQYAEAYNISYHNETDLINKIYKMNLLALPDVNATYLWSIARIGQLLAEPLCEFRSQQSCTRSVIRKDLKTYHGICETLSFEGEITYDGYYNGFKIIPGNYSNVVTYWQYMIILHEKKDLPKHRLYVESGHVIHPMFETTITFQIKQYRRVDTPSQPCRGRVEVQNCHWRCIDKFVASKVKCRLPYIESENIPMCTDPKAAAYTLSMTREAYRQYSNENLCGYCPRKCVEDYYSLIPDVVKPRNETYLKILLQDNTVEVVRESPSYSINVLLSEIGGNLGLFLGVCILTALQIIEILLVEVKNRLFRRKRV